jgi:hypothetical protein
MWVLVAFDPPPFLAANQKEITMKPKSLTSPLLTMLFLLVFATASPLAAMELPSKLAAVPVYSGEKIVQVMDMGNNAMAMLEVKADNQSLMKFYKQEMQGKGWKTAFQAEQEDNAVIHFTKDSETIQISAGKGEKGLTAYQMVYISN